ncbi:hypothetical protein ACFO4O_09235 [Glaciecola siphonariae]|uniref:Group-specific protein n=1 Tax=Glaciecola siphonariae TaxID=521012 RepID=A0ABV9LY31_9ALTE
MNKCLNNSLIAKFFWAVAGFVVILAMISTKGIAETSKGYFFLISMCTWAPVLLVFMYSSFGSKNVLIQYVLSFSFVAVTGVAIYYLSMAAMHAIEHGRLEEEGLIFIVLPFVYLRFAFYGALIGAAFYFLNRKKNSSSI